MTTSRLSLLVCACALLAAGCSGNPIDVVHCSFGGQSYLPGEHIDACGGCSCRSDGTFDCVDTACCAADPCCTDPCCGDPCCGDPCCGDPCCGGACCYGVAPAGVVSADVAMAAGCCMPDGSVRYQGDRWLETSGQVCECGWDGVTCADPECRYLDTVLHPGDMVTTACGQCGCDAVGGLTCPEPCGPTCASYSPAGAYDERLSGEAWRLADQTCTCVGGLTVCCSDLDPACAPSCGTAPNLHAIDTSWREGAQVCRCELPAGLTCAVSCLWGDQLLAVGDPVDVLPNCTCSCSDSGAVTCDIPGCLPSSCQPDASSSYGIGAVWPQACNVCLCAENGDVYCSDRACDAGGCEWRGSLHVANDVFPSEDGCGRTCTCMADGSVECTAEPCAPTHCTAPDGSILLEGQIVAAADSCNQCICSGDGTLYCTQRACGP